MFSELEHIPAKLKNKSSTLENVKVTIFFARLWPLRSLSSGYSQLSPLWTLPLVSTAVIVGSGLFFFSGKINWYAPSSDGARAEYTGCNWHRTANEYHVSSTWFWTPKYEIFRRSFSNFWKKKNNFFNFSLCKIVILTNHNHIFWKKKKIFGNKKKIIKKSSIQIKSLF